MESKTNRVFNTGAVRDSGDGKGRCDLLPLSVVGSVLEDDVIILLGEYQQTSDLQAVRDACQIICKETDSHTAMLELAKHYEAGAEKYGENNWKLGIPVNLFLDSAIRHYLKHRRGDEDENHLNAVLWNLMCLVWSATRIKENSGAIL